MADPKPDSKTEDADKKRAKDEFFGLMDEWVVHHEEQLRTRTGAPNDPPKTDPPVIPPKTDKPEDTVKPVTGFPFLDGLLSSWFK